ncbi:MAG TPA: hypothetical protein DCW90_18905 [Lachnospiraceae bacterium]|nr:hypothetical protein [Lachnospiraceae bacterium]
MKKSSIIILTILIIINSINFVSYADCNMNINYEKLIDFSEIIEGKTKSITQTIGDKEITITRYEEILKIKHYLDRDINSEVKKLIVIENSKIDSNILTYLLKSAYDLITNTSTAQSFALNEMASKISLDDLNRLSENEKINSAIQGKNQGAIVSAASTAVGIAAGVATWEIAKDLAKKGVGILAKVAGVAVSYPVAALTTATGYAALAVGGFAYNQFYVLPISNKLKNLISAYKDIYTQVYEEITNHQWINGNVLITAIPTNSSSCDKGYAHFHYIDGIRYNKSQKAINWDFAKAECKFLNADHDDCYQKAKETIECLWDNLDDPSKCESNPYYYGNSEKYEL